jgi:hypothetical protein
VWPSKRVSGLVAIIKGFVKWLGIRLLLCGSRLFDLFTS